MPNPELLCRLRIDVSGVVQGVGFRPFVCSLAVRLKLCGFVLNHSGGVAIEVEGPRTQLCEFGSRLQSEAPILARLESVVVSEVHVQHCTDFKILPSKAVPFAGTPFPPDIAVCDACLDELGNPRDRRYRYPFINCTNCGPRYTIVRDLPYDRPLTTMDAFVMCPACATEYQDPLNRRYHAQPNACTVCGPQVWILSDESAQQPESFLAPSGPTAERAIEEFHRHIGAGDTVAVKGIGGFHLACSALNSAAIERLRRRKGRGNKPLAVMVADVATARRYAEVNEKEEDVLVSSQRPIVLLQQLPNCELSNLIAPGNDYWGIMLPYSPLHALLAERGPLVMTSGNLSEEPIARTNAEAHGRLRPLADAFLLHNREIHVVCDDSVVRVVHGQEMPIRRSRGFAPLPVRLANSVPQVLAVGGDLKATFCMTRNDHAFMSPHIGDMSNIETLAAFHRAVEHIQRLFRIEAEAIVCDMHPGYLSSQWAREHAAETGRQLIEVQHHHAHIASVVAEHSLPLDRQVIGLSFDGTGYGVDGAIWGSELLIASCKGFQRLAHLKYVPLPGADAAVKHPYRVALAHLWAAGIPWDSRLPCTAHISQQEQAVLRRQLERNVNCMATSSMGRLFDAVASIIGLRQSVSYEAQAAMELEALAAGAEAREPYPWEIGGSMPRQIDPAPILAAICRDFLAGASPQAISARFHSTISRLIVSLCVQARAEHSLNTVAMSGGVFQNVVLLRQAVAGLQAEGFEVLTHHLVPPNDGGLALGQAMVAAAHLAAC